MANMVEQLTQVLNQLNPPPNSTSGGTTTANFVWGTTTNFDAHAANSPFVQISNVLNSFLGGPGQLNNLINGLFGMETGNMNLGDYAWGRGFEDLLNQYFVMHRPQGTPPAAQTAIDSLPKVSVSAQQVAEKLDCVICKDEFQVEETVSQLPCGHVFHQECITRWLKMHNQCPVCRFELPSESDQERTKCFRRQ